MNRLAGTWTHPADDDCYPTELTMTVTEETGAFGIISWRTVTSGHPEPFGDSVWSYTYSVGAMTPLMALCRRDGSWSPARPMGGSWAVSPSTLPAAREVMRRFFTEGGFTKVEA